MLLTVGAEVVVSATAHAGEQGDGTIAAANPRASTKPILLVLGILFISRPSSTVVERLLHQSCALQPRHYIASPSERSGRLIRSGSCQWPFSCYIN